MKKLFLSKKFFFDSLSSPHTLLLYSYSKLLSFAKPDSVSLNNILRDIIIELVILLKNKKLLNGNLSSYSEFFNFNEYLFFAS